jgi:aspartate racemase
MKQTRLEILSRLRELGVQLWREGDGLKYSAPKGVLTPELRAALVEHKAEILAVLRDTQELPSRVPPIQPIPRGEPLALSLAQQRLWMLEQIEAGNPAYHLAFALRFDGPLDREALANSLAEIARRHEILRTRFDLIEGQPYQVSLPDVPIHLPPVQVNAADVEAQLAAEARRPFDLAKGPMWRAALFQLGVEAHVLLIVMHHIISDGWSVDVLQRELALLYNAFLAGKPSPLAGLPIQYADFAHGQRRWFEEQALQRQLSFWTERLRDSPSLLELPGDHPRPAIQTFHGAAQTLKLSTRLTTALNALAQREGATLFMALLAAFDVLLYRYSGQEEIAVGTPIAGRRWLETEGLIGFFVNTLIMRASFKGDPTFRDLVRQVRETALEAYSHQEIPFEKLVEELRPERSLSHNPLFQVMFVLQNTPASALTFTGLRVAPHPLPRQTAKFDLTLNVTEINGGLDLELEYNTDLFEAATITRLLGHFQVMLESILAQPDRHCSELPLLSEAERRQLLAEWNDTQTSQPAAPIHRLFEAQAARTPDAVAVEFAGERLTYQQLNRRANQLAHHLRGLGVSNGSLVGICVRRSFDVMVGLLGILKAGGAWVPLDPTYPKERLAFMLSDSEAAILLTQRALVSALPDYAGRVICLDSDWATIAGASAENPATETTVDDLAYVIYTSGSTGTPKGVMGLHRGAVNRFQWMWDAYPFSSREVSCQKTTLSFVDSVWEIFGPLLQGIPTVLIPEDVVRDIHALIPTLAAQRVTRIVLVPSLLRVILDSYPDLQQRLPDLKICVSSGEALPLDLCQRFLAAMPHCTLINLYGASEGSADSTYFDARRTPPRSTVPIGRPIANTQVYVLDAHLQPVPVGVPGELYVGGEGLARGYLHRPELTAERFIQVADQRLYRTGDRARWSPEGELEYLGRVDGQVKIRGSRVELGEVEAALAQHPAVKQVVALAHTFAPGDTRLIAYAVPHALPSPPAGQLREFVRAKLPEFMVPSIFMWLDALPLTPNGKINRRALPPPDKAEREDDQNNDVAPRDEIERQLARLWEKLLGLPSVGANDDFFDLGGHSLLAIRLFDLIETSFGPKLPVVTLFQAPTLARLADAIRQAGDGREWSTLVPIQPMGNRPPFFCVHGFGGGVIGYAELARMLGPAQPFYGLQAMGLDGVEPPHTRVEDMAAHYVTVMRNVQPTGPYYLGGYCDGGIIAYEMAQQLHRQGEHVALLAIMEGYALTRPEALKVFWRPPHLLRFLRNVPAWLGNYFQRGDGSLVDRIRGQLRVAWRAVRELNNPTAEGAVEEVLGEEAAHLPEAHQKLMTIHAEAMDRYVLQPYPGRVTLFRVQAMSLFRAYDPEMGWGRLAAGGVEIRMIAGAHYNILETPMVTVLADQLKAALQAAFTYEADRALRRDR